ncbi:MAG: homoserine dehydrogenase [Desulfobacteraceae bacterium]|uniref:Homoserine dehydrogenase n=1 Tax=Candidatus Desulfaltia bathyphila TaxID=2841697 RepID=A0A8J6T9L4_9BACT|nr:homoserine dehydrogenase [Candidatus Desulfaltia bathyphila]MBL7194849.1 homoserine dehydrogenase [Desulfobacterales bacterium]
MKQINIGLLGCGTVGTGVAKILIENKDLVASRVGASLSLKHVADIDIKRGREIKFDEGVLVTDARKVVDDPEIDIIVEMIGGVEIAKELILRAIDNGKQIVTANKALLAAQGNILFKAAYAKGIDLAFEASVGGCMPVIKSIRESLVGDRIKSMTGILNGTCNYILSKNTYDGLTFEAALSEAQAKGFAEADPSLDVEGTDTAHKLAILMSIGYGMEINFNDIYIEGISKITPMDIDFANQFGYRIKLLAISKNRGKEVEARVHPAMIPFDNQLSNVNGPLNAITISGDAIGDMMLYGLGAGMMPTASVVVGDIADLARNLLSGTKGRIPLLSYQMENIRKIPIMPVDDIFTNYYFRFSAVDRPGVLSKISGVLGDRGISIKSVHQKGRKSIGSVPIVILTHLAKEHDVKMALSEIEALDIVSDKPVLIRVEETDNHV